MKQVLQTIKKEQKRYGEHKFFKHFESFGELQDATDFFPDATFFVMSFQDMLRINETYICDPELKKIVSTHRTEDGGHEQWFLNDLKRFQHYPDIRWLFSDKTLITRDTSYQLISEIHRAKTDYARIALIMILEATGDVMFSRIPGFLRRSGYNGPVEYFAEKHYDVEQAHELHEDQLEAYLKVIKLSPDVRADVIAMVQRSFAAMFHMTDFWDENIQKRKQKRLFYKEEVTFFREANRLEKGYTYNISLGGVFLETTTIPPIGSDIYVLFSLLGKAHKPTRCKVRWQRLPEEAKPGLPAGVGLELVDLDKDLEEDLKQFLNQSND